MKNINTFFKRNWPIILSVLSSLLVSCLSYIDGKDIKEALRDGTLTLLLSLLIKVIVGLQIYQDKLDDQKETIGKYIKLLSSQPRIKETVSLFYDTTEINNRFYNFFLDNILNQYNNQLRLVQSGVFKCSSEDELYVTKKVLQYCNKSLKAISYQDEEWWCSNEGTLYLDAHEKNIDRKKEKATRIFLLDSNNAEKFKPIFNRHKELEIDTYIIYTDKDSISDRYLVDFVLYDDFLLRKASEVKGKEVGKEATFTTENSMLSKYNNYFEEILTIAKSINNTIPA
ncbi:MAG: hypothetical protein H6598_11215 [Flavobacteriales bacterium]|nr:hypothetical protein [Flavobacteriales bacterium]